MAPAPWAGPLGEERRASRNFCFSNPQPACGGRTLLLTPSHCWGSGNSGYPCPAQHTGRQELQMAPVGLPANARSSAGRGGPAGRPGTPGGLRGLQEGASVAPA